MPSSVIIVALAAAWLVVLVPMVARRRQQGARTADSALAARVVRSGRNEAREKFAMPDDPGKPRPPVKDALAKLEAAPKLDDDPEKPDPEPLPQPARGSRAERDRPGYRPGRG